MPDDDTSAIFGVNERKRASRVRSTMRPSAIWPSTRIVRRADELDNSMLAGSTFTLTIAGPSAQATPPINASRHAMQRGRGMRDWRASSGREPHEDDASAAKHQGALISLVI